MNLGTLHKLQLVLAGAVSTVQPTGQASWEDLPDRPSVGDRPEPILGANDFTLNSTTAVDVVPAAPAGYRRRVKSVMLFNGDNATITVSVQRNLISANTNVVVLKGTRATLENLQYIEGRGWQGLSVALAAQ